MSLRFNLSAVNWQTVTLLEGAHLEADRVYLEELLRCSRTLEGRWGVADLQVGDLVPTATSERLSLRLRRCYAVTPQGYLIAWDGTHQPNGLACSLDGNQSAQTLPLYLCVDAEPSTYDAAPPQTIKNDCGFIHRGLRLTTERGRGELDAIQIGQLTRVDRPILQLDDGFIPECLRLNSHWLLKQRVTEIHRLAQSCWATLVDRLENDRVLESLAAPLATAATLTDWNLNPYRYLERMLGVVKALYVVPTERRGRLTNDLNAVKDYVEPSVNSETLEWAVALDKIEQVFRSLKDVLQENGTPQEKPIILTEFYNEK